METKLESDKKEIAMKLPKIFQSRGNISAAQQAPQISDLVKQRIARAAASRSPKLLLLCSSLTEIPAEIKSLEFLEELQLSDNKIKEVPDWVAKLPRLKKLGLDGNPIEKLPKMSG